MNAGELVISLTLKAGQLKAEAARAQGALDRTGKTGAQAMAAIGDGARKAGAEMSGAAERAGSAWGGVVPVLAKVAGLLGGLAAVKGAVSAYLDQADALGKYADSLGVAVEDVQAWEEAVKHAGGTGEGFRQSLQGLTGNLAAIAATGKGRMLPFLQQLGISAKDASGKVRSAMDILPELAEKFEKMNPAEAAGFGEKLGIDKGTVMLLQQGRKATEAAIKAGKEHIKFTKADALAAARANDAIQDMQTSMQALAMRAIAPAIPLLTLFANAVHRAAQWISQNSETVTAFFTAVSVILLRQGIPAMIRFAAATWAAMAPLLPFIAAAAALGLALDDLWAFITGGDSVLERLMRKFGVTQETIDGLRQTLRSVVEFFWDLWDAVTGEGVDADAAWARVKASWEAAQAWFKGLVDKLLAWFGGLFARVRNWLAGLLPDWLRNMVGGSGGKDSAPQAPQAPQTAPPALADAGQNLTPGAAQAPAAANVDNSRTVTQTTTIGEIRVETQATDAQGIAGDIGGALRNQTAQIDAAYGR